MGVAARRERRVAFHTFGCKLNQFETEALASSFLAHGFIVVPIDQDADAYLINTCTVTSRADHKARSMIRGLARAHPGAPLVVTGCSAETESEALSALAGNIVVVPQSEKSRLLELPRTLAESLDAEREPDARSLVDWRPTAPTDAFALTATDYSFHTRAFLKIQDGCDCRCAYCRVPLARGGSVSLPLEEVVKRAAALESRGRREIVLTGVNLSAWRSSGTGLSGLLREILGATTRARIRLSSLEPESLTPDLVEALSEARVCPHFHVPVQSGSDRILAMMHRRYRSAGVIDGVERLRAARDEPFIAADILVGFPGETEEDFQQTRAIVERLQFAALHVFPFSSRPGTAAASMTPVVPERIRRERAHQLSALADESGTSYAQRCVGKEVEVLLEGTERSRPHGVSANYLKVSVIGVPGEAAVPGTVVRAEITSAGPTCSAQFIGLSV
jgi:threonylcarbamoyladenosine tRNA methylthiotransferase MtaB